MGDFFQFYSNGGFFMHIITLTLGAAVTSVVLAKRAGALTKARTTYLDVADRLAWICVALGLLGSLFGWFDMCAALDSIAPEQLTGALARALGLVPVTTAWGLMVAIPVWTAVVVQRSRAGGALLVE